MARTLKGLQGELARLIERRASLRARIAASKRGGPRVHHEDAAALPRMGARIRKLRHMIARLAPS